MTRLTKPVTRLTPNVYNGEPIALTIAPAGGSQHETLIELRLKGRRTGYVVALSDVYRMAAMTHGMKVARAKKEARKHGIPWKQSKKQFDKQNRITR